MLGVDEPEGAQRKAVEIRRARVREAAAAEILHKLHTKRAQALHTIILVAFSEKKTEKKAVQNKRRPSKKADYALREMRAPAGRSILRQSGDWRSRGRGTR